MSIPSLINLWYQKAVRYRRQLSVIIIVSLVITISGYVYYQRSGELLRPDAATFFNQAAFQGDYFSTLTLTDVASTTQKLSEEVPEVLRYTACEHIYYLVMDKYSVSLERAYLDAFDRLESSDSMRAFTQMIRGALYTTEGDFEVAKLYLNEALDISLKAERYARVADVLRHLGGVAIHQCDYVTGVKYLLNAESYYRKVANYDQDINRIYETYCDIAEVFTRKRDYDQAYTWLMKAQTYLATKQNVDYYQSVVQAMLLHNYIDRQKYDEARALRRSMANTDYKYEAGFDITRLWYALGRASLADGLVTEALAFTRQAVHFPDPNRTPALKRRYQKVLAECFVEIGQYDSAHIYFNEARQVSDLSFKSQVFKSWSALALKQKSFQHAAVLKDSLYLVEKQLFTIEKELQVTELQAFRTLSEKEKALNEAAAEKRILFALLLLVLCSFAFTVFLAYTKWRHRRHREQLKINELQMILARAQLHRTEVERMAETLVLKEAEIEEKEKLLLLKNTLISELENRLSQQETGGHDESTPHLPEKRQILTAEDWQRFRADFDRAFPGFVFGLKHRLPQMTPSEIRLFLLLKIGLDSHEVRQMLGISTESVYKSRYRLRQKLGLADADNLEVFVRAFTV